MFVPYHLVLLSLVVNFYPLLSLAELPSRLTRDGVSALWGFPGLAYNAVNYLPRCGVLSLSSADMYTYIQTVATCEPSMAAYNRTSATSAIYDLTGVLQPADTQIGNGFPVCMCFSLGGSLGKMDFCVHVLEDGTPEGRWTLSYGDIAGGTYVSNAEKALPQCADVNIASISREVYGGLETSTATRATVAMSSAKATSTGPAETTTVSGSTAMLTVGDTASTTGVVGEPTGAHIGANTGAVMTVTISVPVSTETADSDAKKGNAIALGVGLGMGLPAILLAGWGLWYLHRSHKRNRRLAKNREKASPYRYS